MTRRSFLGAAAATALAARIDAAARKAPSRIRVTAVKPVVLKATRNYAGWIIVRIRTDQGVEGIGECFSWGASNNLPRVLEIRDMVDSIGVRMGGANPLQIQSHLDHWAHEANGLNWASAISGVEIALWDILGQVAGLPIYALLGGAVRDRIPLYANHGVFNGATDPREKLERALETRQAGFRMFKWDPFHGQGDPDASVIDRDFAEIKLFRQGFGDDFRLAIDAHTRYRVDTAVRVAARLAEYRPVFFEEPVPQDQLDAYRKIAAAASVPLACGERLANFQEAKRAIDTGAVKVLQPEVGNCGGILEATRIAAYAGACGLQLAPHAWCGPVVNRAAAHVSAATLNLLAQEYPATAREDRWENDLLDPPTEIRNGEMLLPEGPGLGSKLNEKLVASRSLG